MCLRLVPPSWVWVTLMWINSSWCRAHQWLLPMSLASSRAWSAQSQTIRASSTQPRANEDNGSAISTATSYEFYWWWCCWYCCHYQALSAFLGLNANYEMISLIDWGHEHGRRWWIVASSCWTKVTGIRDIRKITQNFWLFRLSWLFAHISKVRKPLLESFLPQKWPWDDITF